MNKDVISISPEDDITDVIANIKSAKNKIIAIIPPQPAGILRSAVNIKLIVKTCEECEKVPVLITADPALIKLAASVRLPVSDDLQSRPHIPSEEDLEVLEEAPKKASEIAKDFVKPINREDEDDSDNEDSDEDDGDMDDDEKNDETSGREIKKKAHDKSKDKNDKKKAKSKLAQKFPWIEGKEKPILIILIATIVLIGFLIYAFVIAPEANVIITIKQTSGSNFSELVTFTTDQSKENAESGVFLLEEVTDKSESEVAFQATGQKDIGNKASGKLDISVYFDYDEDGKQVVSKGSEFTLGGKSYVATEDKTIFYEFPGKDSLDKLECENLASDESMSTTEILSELNKGCEVSTTISIEATEPGEKYNISDYSVSWGYDFTVSPSVNAIIVSNDEAISGGTTEIVTVVQQSDVDAAKQQLSSTTSSEGLNSLKEKLSDTVLPLDNTFSSETSDIVVTPGIGEEVKEGQTAKVSSTTTYKMYTVDEVRIEEFIKAKVSVSENQEITSFGEPYIDRFNQNDGNYSGKLKTTYKTGPKISESSIFEKIAGKKIGDAKAQILDIPGINKDDLVIETSILLNTIPTDENRVHITINKD